MCDVETEDKKVLPESIMERGTVETKEEMECHGSHSVEEEQVMMTCYVLIIHSCLCDLTLPAQLFLSSNKH